MSFDIFDVSTPWDRIFEVTTRFGWGIALLIIFALVIINIHERKLSSQKEKLSPLRLVAMNIISGIFVLFFSLTIFAFMLTEITVSNTDEVRESIRQEYGITLTDESISSLYTSRNSMSNEVLYVTDVDGKVQQYIVDDNEFHFITNEEAKESLSN